MITCVAMSRGRTTKEACAMFEDSFSEGHVYYGRMLSIAAAVIAVAYLFSALR